MADKASVIYLLVGAAVAAVLLKTTDTGQKVIDMATGTTRGIRNNNPGNIEYSDKNPWIGQVGHDGRFAIFDEMENGVRALTILILNYYTKKGKVTVQDIIGRYAPPEDDNPVTEYVKFVANKVGVVPEEMINLDEHILSLVDAIIQFENGRSIKETELISGFGMGMQAKGLGTMYANYAHQMKERLA